jgi:hypothetical protein
MSATNQGLDGSIDLLQALAEVQMWESLNPSIFQTVAGRQLYFGLIRHISRQEDKDLAVESMKEIYYDRGINLTERGVRLTIRSFEADGVLQIEKALKDRRSRRIFLTEKLQEQMTLHALVMKKAMEKNFLVIKK